MAVLANEVVAGFGLRSGRKIRIAALAVIAVTSAGLAAADTKPDIKKLRIEPLDISSQSLSSFHRGGGSKIEGDQLEWRGGLVLTSPHANFGGWSGLVLSADGRQLLAVSDSGSWMSADIVYAGDAPQRVEKAMIGPLLSLDGTALKRGRDRDAEAIALEGWSLNGGSLLVAFEQNARIARYNFSNGNGVSSPREFFALPQQAKKMRRNSGFEAMTILKGGTLKGSVIAFSERMRDLGRNHVGWIWSSGKARQITIGDIGDFDIADVVALDDGSVILLERRFRWLEGMKIRLRRFSEAELLAKSGKGDVLLAADLTSEIDNMEGLAASHGAKGETVLTLISDDNFNHVLQRTLLLQFALTGTKSPQTAKARP